jgi:3D (Asp-Asp-Asp) domain-containing protein
MKRFIFLTSVLALSAAIAVNIGTRTSADPPPPSPPKKETVKKEKTINGLPYTKKLRVYTTSYDGNCAGCRGRTYSGTEVKKGVCAVDPEVIPLGSWFYIPDYGKCHAEDIGSAVKGLRVDVGWEDATKGWLPQGWKDIYLLKI